MRTAPYVDDELDRGSSGCVISFVRYTSVASISRLILFTPTLNDTLCGSCMPNVRHGHQSGVSKHCNRNWECVLFQGILMVSAARLSAGRRATRTHEDVSGPQFYPA